MLLVLSGIGTVRSLGNCPYTPYKEGFSLSECMLKNEFQVCFQICDENGAIIELKENVVSAHVQQPLFCLGKQMKRQWKPECNEFGR